MKTTKATNTLRAQKTRRVILVRDTPLKAEDPLEKTVEKKVKDYANKKGFYVRKFVSPSQRSVPDDLFISPIGAVFFIEFKRKGKKATPKQLIEHEKIRANHGIVYVVDNVEDGKGIIDVYDRPQFL